MHILTIGLSHETAPVEVRERMAFRNDDILMALRELSHTGQDGSPVLHETIILSTCNRVELYCTCSNIETGRRELLSFLRKFHGLSVDYTEQYLYCYADLDAINHLFSVASSIKSMVLGENQIQAQIKQALDTARDQQSTGTVLTALFQAALSVGKRVRNETKISEHSLSISNAAVNFLQRNVPELANKKLLVVGNGKMGLLAVRSLLKRGVSDLTIINRTFETALDVATELNVKAAHFEDLEAELEKSDVVVCSTGAPGVVLTETMVAAAAADREESLYIIDIAVPRDVDENVAHLPGVALYNVDELQDHLDSNRNKRAKELDHVHAIIAEEIRKFDSWLCCLKVKPVITSLRNLADDIKERELRRAMGRFEATLSDKDQQIVQDLTNRIVNKMLHQPLVKLREEAGEGNGNGYAAVVRNLFGLETTKDIDELEYKSVA